jgi:16S rRNA (cytosine1402-N4)-methyltransferase
MMSEDENKPKRRVRYKGTHPKTFTEKYKERKPELYADEIAKVISQGKTPAGMHRSICVNEILEILQVKNGQVGLDATLGYGGHSLEILKLVAPSGKLFAIDVDPFELPRTKERLKAYGYDENTFAVRKMNFAQIDQIVF